MVDILVQVIHCTDYLDFTLLYSALHFFHHGLKFKLIHCVAVYRNIRNKNHYNIRLTQESTLGRLTSNKLSYYYNSHTFCYDVVI